jgi:hypothetical protein
MEERRIGFADAEFLGTPGVVKAGTNLRFSHIGIAVGQRAELEADASMCSAPTRALA